MPQDFRFSFTFAGEQFDEVVLTWGLDPAAAPSPLRRGPRPELGVVAGDWIPDPSEREQGLGWTVDVPDVLRMLDHVHADRASVDQVRDLLLALTQERSKKSGCCVDCDAAIDDYAAAVARCARARARFDDPDTDPYLVSQSAIHAWDCHHFTGRLPEDAGSSVTDYVHNVRPGGPEPEIARLTTDEALAWMTSRTGPKGGLRWRRCRSCQPALPGAWESESNDMPSGTGWTVPDLVDTRS